MSLVYKFKYLLPRDTLFRLQQEKYMKEHELDSKLISQNVKYRDYHKGKRGFILGNGPSLKKISLSKLRNEITFSVNQLTRRNDFSDLKATYHMWADERFFDIDDSRPEDMELLDVMKGVNTNDNKPIVFYKTAAYQMIKKHNLDRIINIEYFSDFCRDFPTTAYSLEFNKVLPRYPTVVHYLILLAVYMGFSEIYLLGCDCTGIINTIQSRVNSTETVYAYSVSEAEKKRMMRSNSVFPIQDELRSYADLFDDYAMLFEYCKKRSVKLFNSTQGSLLNSIPYVKLEDII